VAFIERLGEHLGRLDKNQRAQIEFIDIGGGFWPEEGEWLQAEGTTDGSLRKLLGTESESLTVHYRQPAVPITVFAEQIGLALSRSIPSDVPYTLCTEPGRWLCHESMHLLLTVADRKAEDLVITDGGTNAVGWDRFENDYFPVINLSRPALDEHPCLVAGSLCTPHDLWGYSYFGADIKPGDLLLIPNQGAYTYSLRQEFIKPLPKVATLAD
jgi:diaminopimelate decarboxylase